MHALAMRLYRALSKTSVQVSNFVGGMLMLSVAAAHTFDVLSRIERKGLPLLALKTAVGRTRIVVEDSAAAAAFTSSLPPLLCAGADLSVSSEGPIATSFAPNELIDQDESACSRSLSATGRSTLLAAPPVADALYKELLGMLEEANAGGVIFSLDASRHRLPNDSTFEHLREMMDAGLFSAEATCVAEATAHLDTQLLTCVRRLIEHKELFAQDGVTIDLHPPVFTCEQAEALCQPTPAALSLKNLLLTDKKKRQRYLMTAVTSTQTGFKPMGAAVEAARPSLKPKGGLTFAPQTDLKASLALLPGSVTPLGVLNDRSGEVALFLDQNIFASHERSLVSCHPNACHASVTMHRQALVAFVHAAAGHAVTVIPMDGSAAVPDVSEVVTEER